jgi:replicative DNA helicase
MNSSSNEEFEEYDIRRAVQDVLEDYQRVISKEETSPFTSTGFTKLDAHLDILTPGLHLLGARPDMGKTTLMCNIIDRICVDLKIPSLIFSMKLRAPELLRRIIFSKAYQDPFYHARKPTKILKQHLEKIREAANNVTVTNFSIEENTSFCIDDLIATAKRYEKQSLLHFIAIDRLQLLRSNAYGTPSNPKDEIIDVVSKLKRLALELNIPILLVTNIPRESSRDRDVVKGLPLPRHIKYHDAIDGYIDTITTLYQLNYSDEATEGLEARFVQQSKARLTICKSPRSYFGQVDLEFDKSCMRFFEIDESEVDE